MLRTMRNPNQKKICFAVLVHNRRETIREMLDNIRFFCPNSDIVLYNGGGDSKLCKDLGYPVCPSSKKLSYGFLADFMIETMEWLHDINYDYDYLINLDSDALFAKQGYEDFIGRSMQGIDYMAVDLEAPRKHWYPGVLFEKERGLWRSLFKDDSFLKAFNVGQVFSQRFVQAMLNHEKFETLKSNLRKTKCFAIEEIVFVNMARQLGLKVKSYPSETGAAIRYRPHFTYREFIKYMNEKPRCYLFHPVERSKRNEVRWLIRSIMYEQLGDDRDNWNQYIDGAIPDVDQIRKNPCFVRRKLSKDEWYELVAPLKQGGIGHWKQNNDPRGDHWFGPVTFGSEKYGSLSMIHSRFNVLELIARKGEKLIHYYRDEAYGTNQWVEQTTFGSGAKGSISFIESSSGNFEVVAPLSGGGLAHWYRDNNSPGQHWHGPYVFGKNEVNVNSVSLIENGSGRLVAVVKMDGKLRFFRRDEQKVWRLEDG